jgi:hypothetical protein
LIPISPGCVYFIGLHIECLNYFYFQDFAFALLIFLIGCAVFFAILCVCAWQFTPFWNRCPWGNLGLPANSDSSIAVEFGTSPNLRSSLPMLQQVQRVSVPHRVSWWGNYPWKIFAPKSFGSSSLPDFERGHPILPPVSPIYEELDYGPRTSQSINGPTSIALGWQGNGSTIRPPLNPPLVIGIFCPLAGKFFFILISCFI